MWKPRKLGEVIAARELTFAREGRTRTAWLRVGWPVRGPVDGDPWWCAFRVDGLGDGVIVAVAGEDALQALLLACRVARETVPAAAQAAGGTAYWRDGDLDAVFDRRTLLHALEEALTDCLDVLERVDGVLDQ